MKLKVGTACSGIGSPEVALSQLGVNHEIIFACEKDKYARQTYLANFTPQNMYEDMTKHDWRVHNVDLFIAGVPCQAFSLAGKRLGELDPRGLLFYDFYDYVKRQQPKFFIIENVKGLLSDSKGRTFDNWLKLLSKDINGQGQMIIHEDSLLYNVHWTILNTKDFGVPQNRERVFIVGIRNDLKDTFKFPVGFPLQKRLKDILEPVVDEKYYLSDKMLKGFAGWKSRQNPLDKIFKQDDIMSTVLARGDGEIHAGMKLLDVDKIGFINQDTQASAENTAEAISPTITSGTHGYAQGYITESTTLSGADVCNTIRTGGKGSMDLKHSWDVIIEGTVNSSQDGVILNPKGMAPCLSAGHGNQPKIIEPAKDEPFCVAMRGRNPENPSDRTVGANTEQRLEPNSQGITNTITSVQKDNLIIVKEATKKGFAVAKEGDSINLSNPNSTTRRGRVGDGIANTLETSCNQAVVMQKVIQLPGYESAGRVDSPEGLNKTVDTKSGSSLITQPQNRIRRLTPLECFRLQGFPDSYIKPCSDSQTYKQAGNAISVPVIKEILRNLLL